MRHRAAEFFERYVFAGDGLMISGPVMNICEMPSTMIVKSVIAGEYTAPPAHGPAIKLICGRPRRLARCARKSQHNAQASRRLLDARAAGVVDPIIGAPVRTARSITLQIFRHTLRRASRRAR